MFSFWRRHRFGIRRLVAVVGVAASLFGFAGLALGGLASGTLPTSAFTYLSATDNDVNIGGDGVHLKTKGDVTVKTTYSAVAPSTAFVGAWHYHNGPVILTVTNGTLTLYDSTCAARDVVAGHTFIESTGQILSAKALPERNAGIDSVQWSTTRLYPTGMPDPVGVSAPCNP